MSAQDGKRSAGQKIYNVPASKWNNAMDAGDAWAARLLSDPTGAIIGQAQTDIVKVRNDTGGDLDKGDVICLDDFALDNQYDLINNRHLWFTGTWPYTHEKPYGILLDPIPHQTSGSQLFGRVQLSGICFARINKVYDAHPFAHISWVDGTLTTRTSDTAGTITVPTGHVILTGATIAIHWAGGTAFNATVGTVAAPPGNTSIPFTLASGDVLPSASTAVTIVDNQLRTDWHGEAEILFKKEYPDASGQWWAVVRLSNYKSAILEVITTESIAYGAVGDASVYWGGAITSPVQTIEIDFGWLGAGNTIASGTKVNVYYRRDTNSWRVSGADCG